MFHVETVPAKLPPLVLHDISHSVQGTSISDLIKKREGNPRRAAALARARQRIAARLNDSAPFSLAHLRLEKGLSQAQLATLMGVQQPYIARIERGEDDVKFSTIEKLAGALGLKIQDVCDAIGRVRSGRLTQSDPIESIAVYGGDNGKND